MNSLPAAASISRCAGWPALERAIPITPVGDDAALRGPPDFANNTSALGRGVPIVDFPAVDVPSANGRTEPCDRIANRLAAIRVEIVGEIRAVKAAQNTCNSDQHGNHRELLQFALSSLGCDSELRARIDVPRLPRVNRDQLHSSFAGMPEVQGGSDGLLALVPAVGEP